MAASSSNIVDFFKNQTIFLTGGTGLLGKLLIEKLLRVCWDLEKMYVLLRPKKGKTAQERFEEIFNYPCFKLLQNKNLKDKIFLITGDCEKPSLGLKTEDIEILKKETTCVIHAAANVKFDQSLKEASRQVASTGEILTLAKEMQNLKVFVYISTAYSNCVYPQIYEKFYQPPIKPDTLIDLVNSLNDKALKTITPSLLGEWPNTYIFAKSISENLINNAKLNVPVAIVRPSIICNTLEEPIQGWIDNSYGFIGISTRIFMGVIRSLYGKRNCQLNLVPADYVSNCILAATWNTAQQETKTPIIYNCVGQKLSLERSLEIMYKFYKKFASVNYVWYKSFEIREKIWHDVYVAWYTLLAYFIDGILLCLGKEAKAVKRYRLLNNSLNLLSYFTTREWTFDENNVVNLWNVMCEKDKEIFKFNQNINWHEYCRICAMGIRIYLLKDPLKTLEQGRKKVNKLLVLHYSVVALLIYFTYLFVKLLMSLFFNVTF